MTSRFKAAVSSAAVRITLICPLGFGLETEQTCHSLDGNCAGVGEIEGGRQRHFVGRCRCIRLGSRESAGGRIRRNKNRKKTAGKSTFPHAWQVDVPLSGTLKKGARLAGFGQIDALQGIIVPVENRQTDCRLSWFHLNWIDPICRMWTSLQDSQLVFNRINRLLHLVFDFDMIRYLCADCRFR